MSDGVAVRINARTCRIPDASVQCGSIDPESMELNEPLIVVEVVSLSSQRGDTGATVADYFAVPSIRHYVIVDPFGARAILHSRTDSSGAIRTTIPTQGPIRFDPPGFAILAEALLGTSVEADPESRANRRPRLAIVTGAVARTRIFVGNDPPQGVERGPFCGNRPLAFCRACVRTHRNISSRKHGAPCPSAD